MLPAVFKMAHSCTIEALFDKHCCLFAEALRWPNKYSTDMSSSFQGYSHCIVICMCYTLLLLAYMQHKFEYFLILLLDFY